MNRRAAPRPGALVVAMTLVAAVVLAFRPGVAGTTWALEPSAPPTADATLAPDPTPTESTDPGPTPTVDPGPLPTADPTPTQTPDPTPDPGPSTDPSPTSDPSPTPDPGPTADPGPTPEPSPSADPAASPDPSPTPSVDPDATPTPEPTASPSPVPGAMVVRAVTFARVDDRSHAATYLAEADTLGAAGRFDTYRIRFRVANPGDNAITWIPRLEWRTATGAFGAVPTGGPAAGVPVYGAREWVAAGGGSRLGPTGEALVPSAFLGDGSADGLAVAGERVLGVNPGPGLELPAHSWTEVEFTFRTSVDAAYRAGYELRLVDAEPDGAVTGPAPADPAVADPAVQAVTGRFELGPAPKVALTPGQLSGIPADPDRATASVAYPLQAPVQGPVIVEARFEVSAGASPRYPLAVTGEPEADAPSGFVSPHGAYSATTDACAACHRGHSASGPNLVNASDTAATVCFTCHDGTGAVADVAAQYSDPSIPANDPGSGSFYRHLETTPASHRSADENEFQDPTGTPVLNRHAACADCHDPHKADSAPATLSASGWSAPAAIAGMSGVSVANGAPLSAPTYTWISSPGTITLEYELCLKCHSGFTTLLPHDPAAPSTWELDKGIELNPANGSTHPIEGPGSNGTAAMAASLAGTSPSKQWNFLVGDAVRCVNCHADPAAFDRTSPPAAGGDLSPHVSADRGILFQPYRDRILKGATESYAATDFSLCYVCHSEAPFRDVSGDPRTDTNFQFHGLHVSDLQGKGSGGPSIDTAGDGQGDAICAECHFRIHSTAIAYRAGDRSNERLVGFAPNVTAAGGAWQGTGIAAGTCTLTCHGYTHTASYGPPPDDLILAIVPTPATFSGSGQSIEIRYLVTNATGSTVAGPVSVTDSLAGGVACPSGDLGVGATTTCVASYATTSADVAAGHVDVDAHADAGGSHSNAATGRIELAP